MSISLASTGKIAGVLVGIFATCSLVKGCYDSSQHDRRVLAGFREEVLKNPTPRLLTVDTDGVKRQGILNRGAAFNSQNSTTALIIANDPQSACWYSTLRVVEGQEKLPFLQKIGGGAESETLFVNQAFENYTCSPTSNTSVVIKDPENQAAGPSVPKP